jgi:pimeloyl-ACP methyl ester carboxylesterase
MTDNGCYQHNGLNVPLEEAKMLTEKNFDADGVSIHYAEGPASGLPLVLIHGATLRWQDFLPVLPLLSSRYHTYTLDLRGHGLSGRTPGAYQTLDFAPDVEHFLRAQVGEPAALLGFSLGADVAIQVAVRVPELTTALILEDPASHIVGPFEPGSRFYLLLQMFGARRDLLRTKPSWHELLAAVAQWIPDADNTRLRARAKDHWQLDPDFLTGLANSTMDDGYFPGELLAKIGCPVLLLQGDPALGGMIEDQQIEWYQARLSDCTHVRIPGAGHNLHQPQPILFWQMVSNFLESL